MIKKTPKIKIPKSVKDYVFNKDNYQCKSCGKKQQETQLNIYHIISLAKGGSNNISNLQTLFQTCNQHKKHHFDPRFRRHFT
ncbi:HNH endonuclease [Crocosphaera sp.]|uniref:HNH endonuclease n=1 Tax=Crocosphaera sp. TaxID=2729996 RepID=UPI00260A96A9|nr:HNH endonuclease [Crocosphaera sp.]MDJ0579279.1 HNH endonuclease [Crocosphaera sp.]